MYTLRYLPLLLTSVSFARAQGFGTLQLERAPPISWESCTTANGCVTHNANLTMDANWRYLHAKDSVPCYLSGQWMVKNYNNISICPDDDTCTENCVLDGTDYAHNGVTTSNSSVNLKLSTWDNYVVTTGSRVFMLADSTHYQMFNFLNKEISFQVDVSTLPCGINAALYFVSMDVDGGMARYPTNTAGPKYGTGYCDAQCPRHLHFVNGKANVADWHTSPVNHAQDDANTGWGNRGSCCSQLDIFTANSKSAALIAHPCSNPSQMQCLGDSCEGQDSPPGFQGYCDSNGCDFNSYRMGNTSFYGQGGKVDTRMPFTVVTHFLTDDGTDTGSLTEIKRYYIQNETTIPNSASTIPGVTGSSITQSFCDAQKTAFGETSRFSEMGGMKRMTQVMARGMVMAMSVWYDQYANNTWLDGSFPAYREEGGVGVERGECGRPGTDINTLVVDNRQAFVRFGGIRFGDIGSTT